ncbi:multidrug resistance-associated protein 1-like [Macrosteles quadrilineatus]|uniref:multidrug resistance-associated protein 1-like n=1 Tax=Macrosteles quadrilineatus TaxID=74068 RepID=UPI0023E2A99E|nr:multidrug resistance-associated protein 1-like [Macrosteles quadrilineatus]
MIFLSVNHSLLLNRLIHLLLDHVYHEPYTAMLCDNGVSKANPELSASVPSRVALSWFTPLVRLGALRPLEASDMPDLEPLNSARVIIPRFLSRLSSQHRSHPEVLCDKQSGKIQFSPKTKPKASILGALLKTFGPFVLLGSLLRLTADLLMFVNPQLLRLLIEFISNDDSLWKGCMYASLMYAVSILQIILMKKYFIILNITGMRITTALVSAIYKKSLKLLHVFQSLKLLHYVFQSLKLLHYVFQSLKLLHVFQSLKLLHVFQSLKLLHYVFQSLRLANSARKQTTVGEMINLMAVDVPSFHYAVLFIHFIWATPLLITLTMVFLWQLLELLFCF